MSDEIEVIDELAVAMWAELVWPNGRFRKDVSLGPNALVAQFVSESDLYRRLGEPSSVVVTIAESPSLGVAGRVLGG